LADDLHATCQQDLQDDGRTLGADTDAILRDVSELYSI